MAAPSVPTVPVLPAHRTVLAGPAVQALVTDPAGTYLDGTFGRGGHSRGVLAALSAAGRLLACDRDPAAAAAAAAITDPRFHFERTRFSRAGDMLAERRVGRIAGLLLDLGVSSPQIDDPARGFSWRSDAPLDMRMDPDAGESAAGFLARASVDELTRVIRDHGEERFAASVAKAIVARREAGGGGAAGAPRTTVELAALVAAAIPVRSRKDASQHPATRTFQALRIHVNQELEELAVTLARSLDWLAPGGRLVVISFHSLEDRIVKRFVDAHAHPERALARLPLPEHRLPVPRLRALARVAPDADEVAANPRARSAVMRVAERTDAPWDGAAEADAVEARAARDAGSARARGRAGGRAPGRRGSR